MPRKSSKSPRIPRRLSESITTPKPKSKPQTPSPLSIFTILAYTEDELTAILYGDPIPFSTVDRFADPGVMATIAAGRIVSGYLSCASSTSPVPSPSLTPSTPETQTPETQTLLLSSFIHTTLHLSALHPSVLIFALSQIHSYLTMMASLHAEREFEFEDACELFLAAYMSAAREVYGASAGASAKGGKRSAKKGTGRERNYERFWTRVLDGYFTPDELRSIEKEWGELRKGLLNPSASADVGGGGEMALLTDSGSDTTLVESDSETVVESEENEKKSASRKRKRAATVSLGRAGRRRPESHDAYAHNYEHEYGNEHGNEHRHDHSLKSTLRTAASRLKASARRRMSI